MVAETNELLKKICWKLSRGDVANYVANIKIFQSDRIDDKGNSIKNILGANVFEVGGIKKSGISELLKVVQECFVFTGDEGAHPNKEYLFSREFKLETSRVLEQIKLLFSDSSEIFTFYLKSGHPFYPVFWDYAFLVRNKHSDFILIGSSSD